MTERAGAPVGGGPGATTNGDVSFWWRQLGGLPAPRPALPGSVDADVCIVGAGYTGLWTAYYLKRAQPDLRVVVLEARFAGFGASGRNGGWLVNSVTGGREQYVASHGRDAAAAQQAALTGAVHEVVEVTDREGIDADVRLGGELVVARTPAQLERLRAAVAADAAWAGTDVALLDAEQAAARVRVAGALGASWHPHCARVHPAKLVAGLAEVVERLGVEVFEGTPVRALEPRRAVTDRGAVRAAYVIRATEGYTAGLRGQRRALLPMNSSMVVTEPLPASVWEEIGWTGCEALGDMAHAYVYAQRTADGRIALGGRGVPYRFGSRTDEDGRTQPGTVAALTQMLHALFPAAAGAAVDHAWCGVLGVPRDWSASVGLDRSTGLGWAGGYVGTGVTATNLAGRTLADLVLERDSDRTQLPWVGHRARRWEPEPLRWLGVHSLYRAYRAADRRESAGLRTTSRLARVADRVAGR
ncbi:NAD(P)/FAD-dependent oxidoreductase [Nocardioides sp. SYSU DS0663]|uniref:NAD(P)/FAD-dependent oxidoreductase n=1 Tax=Nocardioides sp. SYSU DS0663 TaxID=3416445 RepID=UPI003F4B19E2